MKFSTIRRRSSSLHCGISVVSALCRLVLALKRETYRHGINKISLLWRERHALYQEPVFRGHEAITSNYGKRVVTRSPRGNDVIKQKKKKKKKGGRTKYFDGLSRH